MFRHGLFSQLGAILYRSAVSSAAECGLTQKIGIPVISALKQSSWTASSWHKDRVRLFGSNSSDSDSDDEVASSSQPSTGLKDVNKPSSAAVDISSAAEAIDLALNNWGRAMDEGDWDTAWTIFEEQFPVDTPDFPPLEELLAWDPDGEEKTQRRKREKIIQEQFAAARVQRIDQYGRAHAVGKRKTSVARVWIKAGSGLIMVNRRPFDQYFPALPRRNDLIAPLLVTNTVGKFDIMGIVHGGGLTGQAQALRHGLARALQCWDPTMRGDLKEAGLLTRDSRIVERKKPGLKKARKAFQWVKR